MRRYWWIMVLDKWTGKYEPISGAYTYEQAANTAVKLAKDYSTATMRIEPGVSF